MKNYEISAEDLLNERIHLFQDGDVSQYTYILSDLEFIIKRFSNKAVKAYGLPPSEYDDIYQDMALCLYRALQHYQPSSKAKFSTYFYSAAHNCMVDFCARYYKSHRAEVSYETISKDCPDPKDVYDRLLTAKDIQDVYCQFKGSVTEKQRKIFDRHYILGESISDISKSMHLNRSSLYRVLNKSRDSFICCYNAANF